MDSEVSRPQTTSEQQTALSCYLAAIVAIANCMAEVCPSVGTAYRDRLLRLPRRLGFDPATGVLEDSRKAFEADLADFARSASEWVRASANHSSQVLTVLTAASEKIAQREEMRFAMLADLAEQMEACSEVDDPADLRGNLGRYAAGLRTYLMRARKEKGEFAEELRRQGQQMEEWLQEVTRYTTVDPATGAVNRREMERLLRVRLASGKPFCVLLFSWNERNAEARPPHGSLEIIKPLAERLTAVVRPRDVVCRWAPEQLGVIFECTSQDADRRARQISDWMSGEYVVGAGTVAWRVDVESTVAVLEPRGAETLEDFAARMDVASLEPVMAE